MSRYAHDPVIRAKEDEALPPFIPACPPRTGNSGENRSCRRMQRGESIAPISPFAAHRSEGVVLKALQVSLIAALVVATSVMPAASGAAKTPAPNAAHRLATPKPRVQTIRPARYVRSKAPYPVRGAVHGLVATSFSYHEPPDYDGYYLEVPGIYLLFVGDEYKSGGGAAMAVRIGSAATTVLANPHFLPDLTAYLPSKNRQFNPFQKGVLRGNRFSSRTLAEERATEAGMKEYILASINDRTVPYPQGDVIIAVLPQGHRAEADGEHGTLCYPSDQDCKTSAFWAFVSNDGTLDSVTDTLSHEIVEAATNPSQGAVFGEADGCAERSGQQNCEIADACPHAYSRLGEIRVAGYWLESKRKCAFGDQVDAAPGTTR